jgi:hypothetical protein
MERTHPAIPVRVTHADDERRRIEASIHFERRQSGLALTLAPAVNRLA